MIRFVINWADVAVLALLSLVIVALGYEAGAATAVAFVVLVGIAALALGEFR